MARIVVGIDGSETAVAGLRWAIRRPSCEAPPSTPSTPGTTRTSSVPGAIVPGSPWADQAKDVAVELEQAMAAVEAEAHGSGRRDQPDRHRGRAGGRAVRGRRSTPT